CGGSAGSYNLMQPEMADKLLARRMQSIGDAVAGFEDQCVIATGNIGCMEQLASATDIPVVHTAELLDWATGGPPPLGLEEAS
ncbi:MAG: glycolate oxidase iron-sulfur subunit, partial [Rhodospirillaceae bacterium]|nr:glycolate oxidase iron-sulfur subunit [Rhodospirillaceae bacterium]